MILNVWLIGEGIIFFWLVNLFLIYFSLIKIGNFKEIFLKVKLVLDVGRIYGYFYEK